MGVWNGAPQVGEAVQSVLSQTAADLELIVIDDDSSDATPAILKSFRDPRLRVTRRSRGGLTSALNAALAMARAPLVARLDADDIALPQRLERQLEYLKGHPDVGLLGTAARETDAAGKEVAILRPPTDDALIRRALIRRNPFVHSSIVMRRAAVDLAGGYDEAYPVTQDYDLWMRMSRVTRMANLSDLLVIRRLLPGRVTAAREGERWKAEARIRWRAVRSGAYPPWCAVWALRPLLAQALPGAARRALRGSGSRSDG